MFLVPKTLGSHSIPQDHLDALAQFTRDEITNVPDWAPKMDPAEFGCERVQVLTMRNPYHKKFPGSDGRLKHHVEIHSQLSSGTQYYDEAEGVTLSLITHSPRDQLTKCVSIVNPSETASFTYSLHLNLEKSGLVIERREIPSKNLHQISWASNNGGVLVWYVHGSK
jgi:hypothetical protein